jgi:hypothetical protein
VHLCAVLRMFLLVKQDGLQWQLILSKIPIPIEGVITRHILQQKLGVVVAALPGQTLVHVSEGLGIRVGPATIQTAQPIQKLDRFLANHSLSDIIALWKKSNIKHLFS